MRALGSDISKFYPNFITGRTDVWAARYPSKPPMTGRSKLYLIRRRSAEEKDKLIVGTRRRTHRTPARVCKVSISALVWWGRATADEGGLMSSCTLAMDRKREPHQHHVMIDVADLESSRFDAVLLEAKSVVKFFCSYVGRCKGKQKLF